ncbi:MAG: GxxExxY protein [Acidobacteriia bacterium]|nr:GxxExxY protein [Terriglobia bacterium]
MSIDGRLDIGYRLDLVVEDLAIVEIKAIDSFVAIHQAQVISSLSSAERSWES